MTTVKCRCSICWNLMEFWAVHVWGDRCLCEACFNMCQERCVEAKPIDRDYWGRARV